MKLRFLYAILIAIVIVRGEEGNQTNTTTETPTTKTTTTETPTTKTTTTEKPTTKTTTTETPTTKTTTTETPTTKTTTTEKPTTETTTTEKPTTKTTTTETPTTKTTTTEKPTTKTTTTEKPTTKTTTTETPTTKTTTTEKPTTKTTTTTETPTTKTTTTTEKPTTKTTTTETTTTETTTTETTTTETTTTETPTTETTTTETPTTETTTTETTTTEKPTTKTTTTEKPTTKTTKPEITTSEPTTTETPTSEQTTTETPTSEQTTTETPTSEQTTTETPISTSTIASIKEYPNQVTDKNVTCILSRMKIAVTVSYNTTDDKVAKKTINVPSTAKISGKCGDKESTMTFIWSNSENTLYERIVNEFVDTKDENTVTFLFKKTDSTFSVNQIIVQIILDPKVFPNAKDKVVLQKTEPNQSLFSTSTNAKYVCSVPTFVTTENMELSISDVNLMAFIENNNISSRSEENCVATSNIGAIVGGVIGALAVIGIIGFVIWRRRRNSTARSEVA